jgi:Csm6 HEPN domain
LTGENNIATDFFLKLCDKRRCEKQAIEVGLVEGFEILSYLSEKHPITEEHKTKKDVLKKCLVYRNHSILAHGTKPIDKDDYESMENVTKGFIKSIIPNIDNRLNEIKHLFDLGVLG